MPEFLIHAWTSFNTWAHSVPFLYQGFSQNEGLWMHLVGAAILSRILRIKLGFWQTVLAMLGIAITWEIIEHFLEAYNTAVIAVEYGTPTRYLYDTLVDIIMAIVMTIVVTIRFGNKNVPNS